jgi:hypothetical protein
MKDKPMTIKQAQRLLGVSNEFQLAKRIGVSYQAVQYWRKSMQSKLPHPWPTVVQAQASART